jgi:hypothetical protein
LVTNLNKLDALELAALEEDVLYFFKYLAKNNIPVDIENY